MPPKEGLKNWLLYELYIAYLKARQHKRGTNDEHKFELNFADNLMMLSDDIVEHRYKPSRGVAFIIHEPVIREIFAAPFRDRVVHHFLYNQVAEWWDKRFIYDSYSCREGKGTLLGIQRLQKHIRQAIQGGKQEAYVIKLDIQGYFMSLPREKIFDRVCWGLERQYDEEHQWLADLVKYLWREIIFDNPIENVRIRGKASDWDVLPDNKSLFCQPPGRGIVIGNLSSQLISNIYLDQLDRFVKFELGYKYYGRYVDDFYVIVAENELAHALADVPRINDFLRSIDLTLHPNKRYIQNVKKGVPFLGVVVFPDSIVAGKRFKGHFYRALVRYSMSYAENDSIISYLGYLKNIDEKKLGKKMFDLVGFDYQF